MRTKVKNDKSKKLLRGVFFLVILLACAKIILVNVLATNGYQMSKMEEKIAFVKEENQKVEKKSVELSSLSRIAQEAEKLSFIKTSLVVFLKEEVPVALR